MPIYDYHCSTNGRTLQVQHRMSESIATWGELCRLAGIEPGETVATAPVEKIFTAGNVMASGNMGSKGREPSVFGAGSIPRIVKK